jgi:type IV fimbrial biogenesis protein FimT
MNKYKGFTLIELMITVAIMSILLTVGLPSFQSIIASSRLTAAANAMVSALQLARMEALKQHKPVAITKKNGDWKNGWIVFVDTNRNNSQGSDEPTIASFDAISPTVKIKPVSTYTNYLDYDESGRVNVGGNFLFCSPADTPTEFRKVIIAATGRIRTEIPTSGSCS